MPVTIGRFETEYASKYLQQLCKHFAHKVDVEFTPESGRAVFPLGSAQLTADDAALTIRIEVADPADVERAHGLIDSHLVRFAFREDFEKMDWYTGNS